MAVVTTAAVDNGDLFTWDLPPEPLPTDQGIPRGEVIFQGTDTIPAKSATDTSLFTLQLNLPRNFLYRFTEIQVEAQVTATAVLADFEPAMMCLVSSDAPNFQSFDTVLWNQAKHVVEDISAFQFALAGTNKFMTAFSPLDPDQLAKVVLDANAGAARLFIQWADPSADTTTAVVAIWRARALQYDQEQMHSFGMHNARPTLQSG